jgi:cephalosporin hydroxylase
VVTPGRYLVVEDTSVNGQPALPDFGPGPQEAVQAFLSECPAFEVDRGWEKFLMTFNPGGLPRRKV